MSISEDRLLPQSIDEERAILGNVLINPPALFEVQAILTDADWYLESHRIIFRGLCELQAAEIPIDPITLKSKLKNSEKLEQAGGYAYVFGLTDGVSRAMAVGHYSRIVKETARLRKVVEIASNAIDRALSDQEPSKGIIEDLQLELLKLTQAQKGKGFRPAKEFVDKAYSRIEDINKKKLEVSGLDTGFTSLNRLTQGFKPGELVIVAGRPGHGKSSIAGNIADNLVIRRKKKVGVFSLEMSGEELAQRSICSEAPLDSYEISSGKLAWTRITEVCGQLGASNLWIDESAGLTISELRARTHRLAVEHGLDLVVVDYLQLMAGSGRKSDNREREISEISRGLKTLAKDLHIPVIALSQLNREIEKTNRRPHLSDLRESGAIEQDADLVLFIWRDELRQKTDKNEGKAELIIAKQRNGKSGITVNLDFDKRYCRFKDSDV